MPQQIGWLEGLARQATVRAGSSWAFGLALAVVLVWLLTGPMFGFSDTWQLVINTGTTIVTFLMVFLIQRAQTRIPWLSSSSSTNSWPPSKERATT